MHKMIVLRLCDECLSYRLNFLLVIANASRAFWAAKLALLSESRK
jgi:hypothetical protein